MIKACIFDIGGVLVKTDAAYIVAITASFAENKLPPPPQSEIIKYLGTGNRHIIKSLVESTYKGDTNAMYEKYYASFRRLFPEGVWDEMEVLPGVERCLDELSKRGVKLACQTGKGFEEANSVLTHFNLLKYFPVLVTIDDVKNRRPNPEALHLTIKRLGITDKSLCLYIGDTFTDIRFAKNAGVKIACVTTGAQEREMLEKEKPDYIIGSLMELLNLVDAPAGI